MRSGRCAQTVITKWWFQEIDWISLLKNYNVLIFAIHSLSIALIPHSIPSLVVIAHLFWHLTRSKTCPVSKGKKIVRNKNKNEKTEKISDMYLFRSESCSGSSLENWKRCSAAMDCVRVSATSEQYSHCRWCCEGRKIVKNGIHSRFQSNIRFAAAADTNWFDCQWKWMKHFSNTNRLRCWTERNNHQRQTQWIKSLFVERKKKQLLFPIDNNFFPVSFEEKNTFCYWLHAREWYWIYAIMI